MQWHIEQAAAAGAGLRQILEAVEAGIEMGGGPATVSARVALDVMHGLFPGEIGQFRLGGWSRPASAPGATKGRPFLCGRAA